MKLGTIDGLDVETVEYCNFDDAVKWVAYGVEALKNNTYNPPIKYDSDVELYENAVKKICAAVVQHKFSNLKIICYGKISKKIESILNIKSGHLCNIPIKNVHAFVAKKIADVEPPVFNKTVLFKLNEDAGFDCFKNRLDNCIVLFTFSELSTVFKRRGLIKQYIEDYNRKQSTDIAEIPDNANAEAQETAEAYKQRLDLENRPLLKICLELAERQTSNEYTGKKEHLIEDLLKQYGISTNEANMIVTLLMNNKARKGGQKALKT